MQPNRLKAKMAAGEPVVGGFLGWPSPQVVEAVALAGYDFVILDNEHGYLDGRLEPLIVMAERHGLSPVVRVPAVDPVHILQALDLGAAGLHVPQVQCAAQAAAAVEAAKYPPLGRRGAAFSTRSAAYGLRRGQEYFDWANRETLVVVHVETAEAVAALEEIAAVEGIDIVFIGPTDLSASMGFGGLPHPEVTAVIEDAFQRCQRQGIAMSLLCRDPEDQRRWAQRGLRYLPMDLVGRIRRQLSEDVAAFREGPGGGAG